MGVYRSRLVGAIRNIVRARWKWAPQSARIAVLHGTNVPVLAPLFGGEQYEVVPLDGEWLYLHPRILLSTLRYFVRIRRFTLTGALAAYAIAVLERIDPAIVVTYHDNSAVVHMAARYCRAARFLAIQNGGRLLERDHPVGRSPQIYLREFACLGRLDVDQFERHGARVETYYPVGSLKDSYYRARRKGAAVVKDFDICLPSQFKPGARFTFSERLDGFAVLAAHVRRFCKAHETTLCVPLRTHPTLHPAWYAWEVRYLEQLLGHCGRLCPNDPEAFTTYALVDRSRVSIGMHTTVLREAFGRGNRVLSCNYTGNPVYTFPLPGPWTLTDPAYEAFEQRLLWLLNASEDEYSSACGDLPSYLIAYDEAMPTHAFLERLIADAVQGVPKPSSGVISPRQQRL